MLNTYSYIVEFRGGTYCCQVQSLDVISSLAEWIRKIDQQKSEFEGLTDEVLKEIKIAIEDNDKPVLLESLKNFWHHLILSSAGTFFINIVQTDMS